MRKIRRGKMQILVQRRYSQRGVLGRGNQIIQRHAHTAKIMRLTGKKLTVSDRRSGTHALRKSPVVERANQTTHSENEAINHKKVARLPRSVAMKCISVICITAPV